jgi:hypothetical protein
MIPTLVHERIDWLTAAFRVTLADDVRRELIRAGEVARTHGVSDVGIAGDRWALHAMASSSKFRLVRESHASLVIDVNAKGPLVQTLDPIDGTVRHEQESGWSLAVDFSGACCADRTFDELRTECKRIACALGEVHENRVRRIDPAKDLAGRALRDRDRRLFVRRSRVRTRLDPPRPIGNDIRGPARHVSDEDLAALATAHETRKLTGITIGKGDVMCRLYDKREELATCSPDKLQAEEARWTSGGWDGKAPVTRVEFQLRTVALRELGIISLDEAIDYETGELVPLDESYLARVWGSCLRWVRHVDQVRTRDGRPQRLTRCPESPLWRVLREGRVRAGEPIKRVRVRGGCSTSQTLGCALSTAAVNGHTLPPMSENVNDYKTNGAEGLRAMLAQVLAWNLDLITVEQIERWGTPEDACVHFAVLSNAARARFARFQRERVPPWLTSKQGSTRAAPSRAQLSTD